MSDKAPLCPKCYTVIKPVLLDGPLKLDGSVQQDGFYCSNCTKTGNNTVSKKNTD